MGVDKENTVKSIFWSRHGIIFLCVLIVALLLPWAMIGYMALKLNSEHNLVEPAPQANDVTQISGPWGTLNVYTRLIEPPRYLFGYNYDSSAKPAWIFRNCSSPAEVRALLLRIGLPAEFVETLVNKSIFDASRKYMIVKPPVDMVIGMDSTSRERLYRELGRTPENELQSNPYSLQCKSVDEWFDGTSLPKAAIDVIRKLVYRRGDRLCFSDPIIVLPLIDSPTDIITFQRVLRRERVLSATLSLEKAPDIESLVNYWGRDGRDDRIEPLLASSVRSACGNLDIVYLLPPFARTRLDTYVNPTLQNDKVERDCHWTSFNFFSEIPDDRYGRTATGGVEELIRSHFEIVRPPAQFGDILLFTAADGSTVHSCVQIADGIVFTKNGPHPRSPFVLQKLGDVKDFYEAMKGEPIQIEYMRLKDHHTDPDEEDSN